MKIKLTLLIIFFLVLNNVYAERIEVTGGGGGGGSTYTAGGTLLNLTGTAFSVKEGTLTTTKGCKYVTGTGLVCDQDYLITETDPLSATKALNNLASVAINTSLISDTAATDDLGTEAIYWRKLYLGSDISFEGATDDTYQTTLTAVDTTLSDKSINIPNASGTMAVSATAPATVSALGDIGVTVLKDIVTSAPLTGGENDVLPGADADLTLAITVAKDIVAGVGLSGGEDNVLPGADADTTLTFAPSELEGVTWGGGAQATIVHTFDVSGTDTTMTMGSAATTFSGGVTATNDIIASSLISGTVPSNLYINGDVRSNGITFAPRQKKALVSFIFDDGYATTVTLMQPLFDTKGVPACAAIVTDNIGGAELMTSAQIIALQTDNWEILSHSKTHPHMNALTTAQQITELTVSKSALEAFGLTIRNFVYPYNENNVALRNLTRSYYRAARGTDAALNFLPLDTFTLSAYTADDDTLLTTYQSYVDTAETQKKWLIFYLHATDANDVTTIGSLIDYIQTKGIQIVTVNQGLDLISNPIENGDNFAIGVDGDTVLDGNLSFRETADHTISLRDLASTYQSRLFTIKASNNSGQGWHAGNLVLTAGSNTNTTSDVDNVGGDVILNPGAAGTGGSAGKVQANGNLAITGDLTVTGGDITLGTSSIFSGGDTASLNNIDAIDATTETTLETALDIGGEVTSTGMASTIIADSVAVTSWTLTTPILVTPNLGAVAAGSTWNLADTITRESIYTGTTSLEETTSATDSGGYIVGLFDEFAFSAGTDVQTVMDDLDAAIPDYYEYTLLPQGAVLDDASPPAITVNESSGAGTARFYSMDFDSTTDEIVYYTLQVPSDMAAGNWIFTVQWIANSTTANADAILAVQMYAVTPADTDTPLEHAVSTYTSTATNVNTTEAYRLNTTAISVANLDSVAANDMVTIRFYRDADDSDGNADNDGLAVDAKVISIRLQIPRT